MLRHRRFLPVLWVLLVSLALPGSLLATSGPPAIGDPPATEDPPAAEDPPGVDDKKENEEKEKSGEQPQTAAPAPNLPSALNGVIFFGGMYNDNDGNLYRVGKYNALEQGGVPRLGIAMEGNTADGIFYDVEGRYAGDASDQSYSLDADIKRYVDAFVSYDRFPVRFDNDPLTYADAAIGNFVVRTDHFDPGRELDMTHADFEARAAVTVPGAEALKIYAGYHRDVREGHDFGITASKCSNCHLEAELRPIDQVTNEYDVGALVEQARWAIEYQYRHRTFEERENAPTTTYDDPVHPVSLAPVFGNRISYSTVDGELPFFQIADTTKNSHLLRGRVTLPAEVKVTGNYSHIETTNDNTGVKATSKGWKGRAVIPVARGMSLQITARGYELDVDDYFVDIVEPVSAAGPTAGRTYQEFYPAVGSIDFLRRSARDRSPTEFIVNYNYKPFRRTSLLVGYEHEVVDRENFDIDRTVTDVFRVNFNTRFGRRVRSRTTFDTAWIDDPFAAEHAALPAVVQPGNSPGNVPFFGLQYFSMYDARQATLTALPDRTNHFYQSVSWSPSSRFSVVGHYRYRGRSNDSLNFSDWERTHHLPGVELWIAAAERWHITTGYNYMRDQAKTLYTVLAFDG